MMMEDFEIAASFYHSASTRTIALPASECLLEKLLRPRVPIEVPSGPNQCLSMDFVPNRLYSGRGFRILMFTMTALRMSLGNRLPIPYRDIKSLAS